MIEKKSIFLLNRLRDFRPNILSSDANYFLLYSFWGTCSISPTSKYSLRFLSELPNNIRMAWKLPLFDTVLVLSSRCPLSRMFCLPHNIMVLMIALSAFILFSNISWFCVEILYGKVSFGFWPVYIIAMPASSDVTQVPQPSQWRFVAFGMELLLEAFSVLEDLMDCYASHNICKKPPICEGLYTSHLYFSNHEGWNTSFLVCLSLPLTTVLEEKSVYEGGRVKWFLWYLIFCVQLKSSWIDLATYHVPNIKVGYDMLISGRKLGNTYKPRKSLIDKSSNWTINLLQRLNSIFNNLKTEHWQAVKC